MADKRWRFRSDMLGHYINGGSSRTFQDAEDRLNYLEEKQHLPDMRSKVSEYIRELDIEIKRCTQLTESKLAEFKETTIIDSYTVGSEYLKLESRLETLSQIRNDLQSRLEES